MTPRGLDGLLRSAAATATGLPLANLPPAAPRSAPAGTGADYASPLPLRLIGIADRSPAGLAADIAAVLRDEPGIAGASATGSGFVNVAVPPRQRLALLQEAGAGWEYLASLSFAKVGKKVREWPHSPLEEAETVADAARVARADACGRLAAFLAPEGAPPSPLGLPESRHVSWRDPYLDAPPGGGAAARLLAALGEASLRTALCRETQLTVELPGVWGRNTEANPAFALRYAHAHAHTTVFSWAPALGLSAGGDSHSAAEELADPAAAAVAAALFDGPGTVVGAHHRDRPSILVRYLEELAAAYRDWVRSRRTVRPDGASAAEGSGAASAVRLDLCLAVAEVLAAGLFLLCVSAPTQL